MEIRIAILVCTKIPPVLLGAEKNPYDLPKDSGWDCLVLEIKALDTVLGANQDVPPNPSNSGMIERGPAFVSDVAMGAVQGAATSPFRTEIDSVKAKGARGKAPPGGGDTYSFTASSAMLSVTSSDT